MLKHVRNNDVHRRLWSGLVDLATDRTLDLEPGDVGTIDVDEEFGDPYLDEVAEEEAQAVFEARRAAAEAAAEAPAEEAAETETPTEAAPTDAPKTKRSRWSEPPATETPDEQKTTENGENQ